MCSVTASGWHCERVGPRGGVKGVRGGAIGGGFWVMGLIGGVWLVGRYGFMVCMLLLLFEGDLLVGTCVQMGGVGAGRGDAVGGGSWAFIWLSFMLS